jgi:uncharacterized protein with NRDE domain
MCLLVMISRVDDEAPLVVGANRDEYLERPATAVTVLQSSSPRILGGRDEEAGGTWLAVNEHGLVAALTNRPASEGRDPSKRSRGELPLALARHPDARTAVEDFVDRFHPQDYNPAWLLVGDRHSLYSLDMTGDAPVSEELPAGVHILENVPLSSPSAKVDHVRAKLGKVGAGGLGGEALISRLRRVLADHCLPGTLAACVHTETYGTRSATVVRVAGSEQATVSISVADGHPCEAAFVDARSLWES